VDIIVSIVLSILLRNVWALVLGLLAGQMTLLCVSYIIHPFRPGFSFNLKQVKELFGFGKWILGSSILGFIVRQGDDIVVGKMLNAATLGFYQMAFRLSNLPTTEITHVISRVTFAAYSKIQDNVSRLRNAVSRTLRLVSVISVPMGGGMFILAPEMTGVFLGEKWLPMVPAFELLCFIGVVRSITANFGSILNSQGRPDIQTRASLLNMVILALSIYHLVVHFGMMGAVYSRMLTLLSQFYVWPYVLRILQMSLKEMLKTFSLPFISTLLMVFSIAAAKNIFYRLNLLNLLSLVGVGLLVYFPVLFLLDRIFNHGIMKELKTILNEFKRGN
jgi:O-antigen/teichoic acid export membrane protein